MESDDDRRHGLPPLVRGEPPLERFGPEIVRRTRGVQIPDRQVAQVVGHVGFVAAETPLHESARAAVDERGARLPGVRLEEGVVTPRVVPQHGPQRGVRHTRGVVLSGVFEIPRARIGRRDSLPAAAVADLADEDARRGLRAHARVAAVAADLDVVGRAVGARHDRQRLTDAPEIDAANPRIGQTHHVERLVSPVVLPRSVVAEVLLRAALEREVLDADMFIMGILADFPAPFGLHGVHDRFGEGHAVAAYGSHLVIVLDRNGLNIGHVSLDPVRRQLLRHQRRVVVRKRKAHPVALPDAGRRSHLHRERAACGVARHRREVRKSRIVLDIDHHGRRPHLLRVVRQVGRVHDERRLAAARALEHEITPADENLLAAVVPLRVGVFLVGGGWVHHVVVVVVEDETPLGEVDHRPGIGIREVRPRIAPSGKFQLLEQRSQRPARGPDARGIGAVVDDVVNLVAQSPDIGRSLLAVLVTGIRIIEQDVIRSSGLKIPPCQSGVGIHLLVEQRHVQRDEFPVFPVRIDRHRDRRLLRSGVERRGSLDRQHRLAKHGRPARRRVDHRLGDVVLHDLESPGLPEAESLVVGSRHRQSEIVEDGKREFFAVEQFDRQKSGRRVVSHRLESRTVTDDDFIPPRH